ncbi:MAG: HEPN domain-containing protein [Thermoflexales bacterium]|nr:HEPN domain-containing protein [Thermoflexales bacterium]
METRDPRLKHLRPAERRAVARFCRELERALPGRVQRLILYGSKARGDTHPESDVDLLVVVDSRTPEVTDTLLELTARPWREGVHLEVLEMTPADLAAQCALGTPFIRNVAEEGIPLKGEPIMVGEGKPEQVVQQFLQSARERIQQARLMVQSQFWGAAMSLVYYAFLDAADAALAARGIRAKSHTGTVSLFGLHFVRTGEVDEKYSHWFRRALKHRLEADYERRRDFAPEQVEEAIAQAEEFVQVIETLLAKED